MLNKFFERLKYDGLTYDELCEMAGGGGKAPVIETVAPPPIQTKTDIGSQLDTQVATLDESDKKMDSIDKKKLGTRGLQIPLESTQSNTTTTSTPASTGLQV
jgi:hypothetical protein